MERCRFIGKSKQMLGEYSWHQLETERAIASQKDVRFELFTGDIAHGFMFDFDHLSYLQGMGLLAACESVLGEVEMHQVFTGNGHHVYVPVENGLAKEDCRQGKEDYLEKAYAIAEEMGWDRDVVDGQVFSVGHYGRVPGSTNSKNGKVVTYIKKTDHPCVEYIEDIIEMKETPVQQSVVLSVEDGNEEVVYRPKDYCLFIKYCRENAGNLPHAIWLKAMQILGYVDDFATANEISLPHSDYTEAEVRSFTNPNAKKYFKTCADVAADHAVETGNVCQTCPHFGRGGCASMVSGELPTPSAHRGFHGLNKNMDIVPGYVHATDVVCHWVNINKDHLYRQDNTLYKWAETGWEVIPGIGEEKKFPLGILKELQNIPRHHVYDYENSKQLRLALAVATNIPAGDIEDFDDERFINFANGILDLETYELVPHHPSYKMVEMNATHYDVNAECPRWEEWLTDIVGEEGAQLLQCFFGLALSNVPVEQYQQFLWLEGASGTGKSTVMRVLREMLAKKKTLFLSTTSIGQKDGGYSFDYRGKSAIIFDDFKPPPSKFYANNWEAFITQFTTAFEVGIRRMREDTHFVRPKCTLFFSANGAPPITGEETGISRRMRILRFYKRPEEQDNMFVQQFMEEMSGIVNWALKGLTKYKEFDTIPIGAHELEEKQLVIEDVDDPIARFVREHLEFDYSGRVMASRLYNVFCTRMRVNTETMSNTQFGRAIANQLPLVLGLSLPSIKKRAEKGIVYRVKFKNKQEDAE